MLQGSFMAYIHQTLLSLSAVFNLVPCAPRHVVARATSSKVSIQDRSTDFNPVNVDGTTHGAGSPVLQSFVSYSIEFAFFPDFAGNKSSPNKFSDNLLNNLKSFQGSKPNIRVGGNTQDYYLFNADQDKALTGEYFPSISQDYPLVITIGPAFFDSYTTWPDTKFIHGFNLAKNGTDAVSNLTASVPFACRILPIDNLLYWEMGNEPDLYKTSAQGIKRPTTWNERDYVLEWNAKVTAIKDALKNSCDGDWTEQAKFKWLAPSFAGTNNSLKAVKTWQVPEDPMGFMAQFSSHNYISGATVPGVTLAGTLMNHTRTVLSVSAHNKEQQALKDAGMGLDYVLGETNSLYNQGAPGLSNSFGAALWGVDFNLLCASTNIKQVYMHQGTDYRYASWQPITTNKTTIGTKAPYYGNVAVAAALGDITKAEVRVKEIKLKTEKEAAYAIYADNRLKRLMVINMNQYNYSVSDPSFRPVVRYCFTVPTDCAGPAIVQRLLANGSDAITGITFNGYSYNYELNNGMPQLLSNATKDETVIIEVDDGGFSVDVPWSSAALVQFTCL